MSGTTYDAVGNPLTYNGYTMIWRGRQLVTSFYSSSVALIVHSYTYNDEGIRTSKSVNGTVHNYTLDGSTIISEQWDSHLMVFLYDESGSPIGLQYRNTGYAEDEFDTYYFEKNIFGDVVGIYTDGGSYIGGYTYDAWGNFTTTVGSGSTSLQQQIVRQYNPFRYRGYYYDTHSSLYYLQSRYYDPSTGRFINADNSDVILATPNRLTDKNLYAYCDNNPIMRTDESGEFWNFVIGGIVGGIVGGVVAGISSYIETGEVDWASVAINTAVGAINRVVAASGLGMLAQAGISAVVSGVGNFVEQVQADGIDNVNYIDVGLSTVIGGATSMLGTGAGKLLGGKCNKQATELVNLGKDKLLTGMVRKSVGQSSSALMRQGHKYIAQATVKTNIFRGISSVAGTGISGSVGLGYNVVKSRIWGW